MRFYRLLGFERRGRLNFETAYNLFMVLPDDGDTPPWPPLRGEL